MRPQRRPRRATRPGDPPDRGFSLVETLVAITVVTVVMAATGPFLVRTMQVTHRQDEMQRAAQVAADAMERVRALPVRDLVAGREATAVAAQWDTAAPPVTRLLAGLDRAVDDTAGGRTAALPLSEGLQVGPVALVTHWYVGTCWLAPGADCDRTNRTVADAYPMNRVVVAVSWPSTGCAGGTCWFTTSTLLTTTVRDPSFGT